MILIRIVLIFIISFLDSLILFIYDINILTYIFIHIIFYLLIRLLSNKFTNACDGVSNYIVLFMPGLGGIIVGILYVTLYYFQWNGKVLSDYERYLDFEHNLEKEKKLNYKKEIGTFSFIDQIRLLDVKRKKDLIVEYSMDYKDNKIDAIQRGLQDDDSEVRHYSAVTINMLESEYTKMLADLRNEYNTYHDNNSLMKLYSGYKDYLTSGLIESEVYQIINLEYIEILQKLLKKDITTLEIINQLVKAYLRSSNILKAEEINKIILSKYPNAIEGYINRINIAFEKKDYEELLKTVNEAKSNDFKNKEELNKHLLFWTV